MPKTIKFQNGIMVGIDDERTLSDSIQESILRIKIICTNTINISGIDMITQQNAALGVYPPERCEAIKSYIAACRNEYLRCKAMILAAQTNNEADAVQFVAPNASAATSAG